MTTASLMFTATFKPSMGRVEEGVTAGQHTSPWAGVEVTDHQLARVSCHFNICNRRERGEDNNYYKQTL